MAYSQRLTSWSFSRLNTYEQCPFKIKCSAILKIKEPQPLPGSPMYRGDLIHKAAEAYVRGAGARVPKELAKVADEAKRLRATFKRSGNYDPNSAPADRSISMEETWALTKDWGVTRWNDWNGCWLRIKTDVTTNEDGVVEITDWKTGKYSPQFNVAQYEDQVDLYKLGALIIFASLGKGLRVRARLLYTDHGITHPAPGAVEDATPKDLPALKKKWAARVKPMMNDTTFAPKPNRFCGSCHYRASNSGPCKF